MPYRASLALGLALSLGTACGSPPPVDDDGGGIDASAPDGSLPDGSLPDGGDLDGSARPDGHRPDSGGPPVRLCPDSTLSFAGLEAAHDALQGGATEAPLSADGCIRMRLTPDGSATNEELVYDGVVVQRFAHSAAGSSGEADRDHDGFFEHTLEVIRESADAGSAIVTELATDGTVLRRETYTLDADTLHRVVEIDDGTGTLVIDEEVDAPRAQPDAIQGPVAGTGAGSCTQAQADQIAMEMQQAIDRGLECASTYGIPGLEQHLSRAIPAQGIRLQCASAPGACAEIDMWSAIANLLGLGGEIVITIDPGNYFGAAACANHQQILLHELLHALIGIHTGYDDPTQPESRIHDRVYACAGLCNDTMPTKCQCASCLRTDVCDPRCAGLAECEPDLGAQCRCFARPRWYPTMTECTVGCPSGLACFSATCRAVSYACD